MRVWISRDKSGFDSVDDFVHIWAEDKKPEKSEKYRSQDFKRIVFHRGAKDPYDPIAIHFLSFQNLFLTVINPGTCKLYKLTRKLEKVK